MKFAFASLVSASSIGSPTTSGTGPLSGGGGASKPSTGKPAIALTMKSCQIGAATVPPNTDPP